MGVFQSSSALGRVIGPFIASAVAAVAGLRWPFIAGAVASLSGVVLLRHAPTATDTTSIAPGTGESTF
jgi:MFS family permease